MLLRGWDSRDIFNLDESGMFFKMLPGKRFAFAKQDCSRGKKYKDRLTTTFCTNMDRTEKERILVIGKVKKPALPEELLPWDRVLRKHVRVDDSRHF